VGNSGSNRGTDVERERHIAGVEDNGAPTPQSARASLRWVADFLAIAFVVGLIWLAHAITQRFGRTGPHPPRGWCSANLNAIGKAMAMYESDPGNHDLSPLTFGPLLDQGNLSRQATLCPLTDTPLPDEQDVGSENRQSD